MKLPAAPAWQTGYMMPVPDRSPKKRSCRHGFWFHNISYATFSVPTGRSLAARRPLFGDPSAQLFRNRS